MPFDIDAMKNQSAKKSGFDIDALKNGIAPTSETMPGIPNGIRDQLAKAGARDVEIRNNVITPTLSGLDKAKQYILPDKKLSDFEVQEAKQILKEYEPQYKTGVKDMFNYGLQKERQNDPNKTAETMRQLEAKVSLGSQVGGGIAQSFGGKNVAALAPTLQGLQTQNPIAYGAGQFAGEAAKYGAASLIVPAIPGVGGLTKAAGSGISTLTKGKVGAELATRIVAGRLIDLPVDIQNVITNGANKSAGDVALNFLTQQGIGLASDVGVEGLGIAFKLGAKKIAPILEKLRAGKAITAEEAKVVNDTIISLKTRDFAPAEFESPLLNKMRSAAGLPEQNQAGNKMMDLINRSQDKTVQTAANPNIKTTIVAGVSKDGKLTLTKQSSPTLQKPGSTQSMTGELKERGYSESIRTKSDLPDELVGEFKDNPSFYEQLSNKTTKEGADAIFAQGVPKAKSDFDVLLKQKDPRALPLGNSIAKEYMAQGDREGAVLVLRQMAEELTKSGQFSQAAAINLMKNDPLTAMTYISRQIDKMNIEGASKFGKKWSDFKLTDVEMEKFSQIKPGDEAGIKQTFEEVGSRIARVYPSTVGEKIVELSRISMLLNPKTQVRNVASNALLLPLRQTSDKISALGQNAYALINPKFKKTQALFVGKDAKNISKQVWSNVKDNLLNVDKYERSVAAGIKNKEVFKMKKYSPTRAVNTVLPKEAVNFNIGKKQFSIQQMDKPIIEYVRDLTYGLLQSGDNPFVKKNFTDRLSSYLQAQGIKNLDDVPQDAIDLATSEALKATFKDDNALTQALSVIKRKSGIVGEAALPFTKTPANIAMRGIDYSPIGIATAIRQFAKGGNDPALLIDNLSKVATGTAGIWLGIALAKEGIITGKQNDNKNIAAFDRAQGKLPYALKVGDKYISYDWVQPAAIPLIIGTAIYDSSQKQDEAMSGIINGTVGAATAVGDRFLELSPLQNIKDIIGGYGSPTEKGLETVAEFPQRLIPSVLGAAARVADPTARQAFSADNFTKTQLDQYKAKLPGQSDSLPANVDVWGREIKRLPTIGQRATQEFASPSAIGAQNITPADKEIERIYQATSDSGVIPKKAEWTREYKGKNYSLTNSEWSQYQKTLGQTSKVNIDGLVDSSAYKNLSDDDKSKAIQRVYEYAQEKAKAEFLKSKVVGYKIPKNIEKADKAKTNGIGLPEYFAYQSAIALMETDKDGNGDPIEGSLKEKVVSYIKGRNLPTAKTKYLIEDQGYKYEAFTLIKPTLTKGKFVKPK